MPRDVTHPLPNVTRIKNLEVPTAHMLVLLLLERGDPQDYPLVIETVNKCFGVAPPTVPEKPRAKRNGRGVLVFPMGGAR